MAHPPEEGSDAEFFRRTWRVLDAFRDATPLHLTRHHLDSFDAFVRDGIRNTVASMKMVVVKRGTAGKPAPYDRDMRIEVFVGGRDATRLFMDRPTLVEGKTQTGAQTRPLLPNEARLRGLTYASNLYADIVVEYSSGGSSLGVREFSAVRLGSVPIMLHSSACALRGLSPAALAEVGECPHDAGGYFIVQGREKVIVAQERAPFNRLFFTRFEESGSSHTHTGRGKGTDKVATAAYIQCVAKEGSTFPKRVSFSVMGRHDVAGRRAGAIVVRVPFVGMYRPTSASSVGSPDIPLFALFRALGVQSDRDIIEHIFLGETPDARMEAFIRPSIVHAASDGVFDQRAAHDALRDGTAYRSLENLKKVLEDDLFPNAASDMHSKAMFLGDLVRRITRACVGAAPVPDRDHFSNRRFDVSGALFATLFRDSYLRFHRDSLAALDREWFYGPWKNANNVLSLVNETNVRRLFRPDKIDDGLRDSLKGSWNVDLGATPGHEYDNSVDGIVQDLSRVSYLSYVSHVRRVNHDMPGGEGSKQVDPHKLHPSQWGYVCPIDSPDGPRIGLQKHLAVMAHVTLDEDVAPLLSHLREMRLLRDVSEFRGRISALGGSSRVFANDLWTGVTFAPDRLVSYVRALRRAGVAGVGPTTSVAWQRYEGEVRILTDAGRCCRPLYVLAEGQREPRLEHAQRQTTRPWSQWIGPRVSPGRQIATFEGLCKIAKGLDMADLASRNVRDVWEAVVARLSSPGPAEVELLDVEECADMVLAMTPTDAARRPAVRFTHCEMHPASVLSAVSATFPLFHHQNGGYTYLSLAQTKQAIGWYAESFASRMDTIAAIMHYPQVPLVTTGFARWLCNGRHAHGENLVVAVACYSGYNQDDGVLLNADSVARGMFHVTTFKTREYEENAVVADEGGTRVVFANPLTLEANGLPVDFSSRFGRYDALDADGFPTPGTVVREDDMVMGRVSIETVESVAPGGVDKVVGDRVRREVRRDVSDPIARGEAGIVDHVFACTEGEGRRARVCIRQTRVPELGDKVASRFAQKGVVGIMMPARDMPFCHSSGIVPDIIFNPNAFPKRMTVAHLLEALLAKSCAVAGTRARADTFEPTDVPGVAEALLEKAHGMHRMGDEVMYNGQTGEQMACSVFVGVNYVGRLKHMVADKINFRATGPVAATTHQATKGRKDKGGLRIGEMERDVILSHGAASMLKESYMERADAYAMHVDSRNGKPCIVAAPAEGLFRCVDHDAGHRGVSQVKVPYATQVLLHELNALALDVRIETGYTGQTQCARDEDSDT